MTWKGQMDLQWELGTEWGSAFCAGSITEKFKANESVTLLGIFVKVKVKSRITAPLDQRRPDVSGYGERPYIIARRLNALRFVHFANSLLIPPTLNISDSGSYFLAKDEPT